MSVGLALSGGGAKGIAHIGVLEALKDNNINVDYISGTSSGSIVAAMYGAGYTPNEILKIVVENTRIRRMLDYDKNAMFKLMSAAFSKKISVSGFIKGDRIENVIRKYLNSKNIYDISDYKMPIAIPTVNVRTGEIVYYTSAVATHKSNEEIISENEISDKVQDEKINENKGAYYKEKHYDDNPEYRIKGDIAEIVRASISFPGVFRPKYIGGELYIDGGTRVNTPVKILKEMGASRIIAVSFDCNKIDKNNLKNVIGISSQAFEILTHEASESELELADINVKICTRNISLFDFSKSIFLAKKGYNIVSNNINYIKSKLRI